MCFEKLGVRCYVFLFRGLVSCEDSLPGRKISSAHTGTGNHVLTYFLYKVQKGYWKYSITSLLEAGNLENRIFNRSYYILTDLTEQNNDNLL